MNFVQKSKVKWKQIFTKIKHLISGKQDKE